ncbi:DUF397 domain-containing protein [Streptomyces sp. NPDC050504]|uniref:DUF397 domain-containing protein n=1 Tax=Streptomyces sp. NPDC050504 TaxID=3365618 RepID=UPI0037A4531E
MNEKPSYRKSTYSGNENDACVEVADNMPRILVRDTKDHGAGRLEISPAAWTAFISDAKQG